MIPLDWVMLAFRSRGFYHLLLASLDYVSRLYLDVISTVSRTLLDIFLKAVKTDVMIV